MNIQVMEAAKGRINVGTLIFKAKAVLALLSAAVAMLASLKEFFDDLKRAKANDGVIDIKEFSEAVTPVVAQFNELELRYQKLLGSDSFKLTNADFDAVNFKLTSLPNKVIPASQGKEEQPEAPTSNGSQMEETQQPAQADEEQPEEEEKKTKKPQNKPAQPNDEV